MQIPNRFTHQQFFHTYISINPKEGGRHIRKIVGSLNNNKDGLFDLIHKLFLKQNIDLLAICYEGADKIVSHPHIHLLLNATVPEGEHPMNYIAEKVEKVMVQQLKVEARIAKLGRLKVNTFIKYKGNGFGTIPFNSNPKAICPKNIQTTCPFKAECLNNFKPKSCCNVVKYVTPVAKYIQHCYNYIEKDKRSTDTNFIPKKHVKFYSSSNPTFKLHYTPVFIREIQCS